MTDGQSQRARRSHLSQWVPGSLLTLPTCVAALSQVDNYPAESDVVTHFTTMHGRESRVSARATHSDERVWSSLQDDP